MTINCVATSISGPSSAAAEAEEPNIWASTMDKAAHSTRNPFMTVNLTLNTSKRTESPVTTNRREQLSSLALQQINLTTELRNKKLKEVCLKLWLKKPVVMFLSEASVQLRKQLRYHSSRCSENSRRDDSTWALNMTLIYWLNRWQYFDVRKKPIVEMAVNDQDFIAPVAAFVIQRVTRLVEKVLMQESPVTRKMLSHSHRALSASINVTLDNGFEVRRFYCMFTDCEGRNYQSRSKWLRKKCRQSRRSQSSSNANGVLMNTKFKPFILGSRSCWRSIVFNKERSHTCRSAKNLEAIRPVRFRSSKTIVYQAYHLADTLDKYRLSGSKYIAKREEEAIVQMSPNNSNSFGPVFIIRIFEKHQTAPYFKYTTRMRIHVFILFPNEQNCICCAKRMTWC